MIDAPTVIVVVGAAIQALPPAHNILMHMRRRPNAAELARALPFTPVPVADPELDQLLVGAGEALDARP